MTKSTVDEITPKYAYRPNVSSLRAQNSNNAYNAYYIGPTTLY